MTNETPDNETSIDAIPTTYDGVHFRSRLEADWAATLNHLNITWEYEPETLTLPSGTRYLPDFWLPEQGTWIEVKGPGIPRTEKAVELAQTRTCHCTAACTCAWPGGELVLIGHPPEGYTPDPDPNHHNYWGTRRYARQHRGHLRWSGAHGPGAWLARCQNCHRAGFFSKSVPLRCRVCKTRLTSGHVFGSGDRELAFATSMPLTSPIPEDTTPRDEFGAYLDEDDF